MCAALVTLARSRRFTILFISEVIWGSSGGAGSSSSSKIAHDFKMGLLVRLNLRGLEEEPAVSFETYFRMGVTGPLPRPVFALTLSHTRHQVFEPLLLYNYSCRQCCLMVSHGYYL